MEERHKIRTNEEKRNIENRLSRIIGQLGGISRMVEEDRYCGDILDQLAAVKSAVQSLAGQIMGAHMRTCLVEDIQRGDLGAVDELIGLIKKFQ